MNAHLIRWLLVMGPAFLINEEVNFACAMVWVVACLMVILSLPRSVWFRR